MGRGGAHASACGVLRHPCVLRGLCVSLVCRLEQDATRTDQAPTSKGKVGRVTPPPPAIRLTTGAEESPTQEGPNDNDVRVYFVGARWGVR